MTALAERIFLIDVRPNGKTFIIHAGVYFNNGYKLVKVRTNSRDVYCAYTGDKKWVHQSSEKLIEASLIAKALRSRSMYKSPF